MNELDLSKYRKDAKGNLVPVDNIKEMDLLRDELVMELAGKLGRYKKRLWILNVVLLRILRPLYSSPPTVTTYRWAARKAMSLFTASTGNIV